MAARRTIFSDRRTELRDWGAEARYQDDIAAFNPGIIADGNVGWIDLPALPAQSG
jgi:hypothetical protein